MQVQETLKKGQVKKASKGRGKGDKNVSAVPGQQDILYAGFEYESLEVRPGCWTTRTYRACCNETGWKIPEMQDF